MKLATSMQQQWIDLENKRLDAEKQEREHERQHELQMMQYSVQCLMLILCMYTNSRL